MYYIVRRISGECFATSEEKKKKMMMMMVWVDQCGGASTAGLNYSYAKEVAKCASGFLDC